MSKKRTLIHKPKKLFLKSLLVSACCTYGLATQAALICPANSAVELEWGTLNWTDPTNIEGNAAYNPTLAQSFVVGGVTFDFQFSSTGPGNLLASLETVSGIQDGGTGQFVAAPNDYSEVIGPGDLSGDGIPDQGLAMVLRPLSNFDVNGGVDSVVDVVLDVGFSEVLSEFEFTVADVDQSGPRRDQIEVSGVYQGVTKYPGLVQANPSAQGSTFTLGGANNNIATANIDAGNALPTGPVGTGDGSPGNDRDPADATVFVRFEEPIDSIRIVYSSFNDGTGGRGITMFGNFVFCPGFTISGNVFDDTDGSGGFTGSDPGIGGATIQAFVDDGTGNPTGLAEATAVTAADGSYTLPELPPGNFVLVETDPTGYVSVTDIDGTNDNQILVTIGNADITGQNFLDIKAADLNIVKSDTSTDYTPGGPFSYSIVVSNAGPSDANGANVVDSLPGWAISPTWVCGSVTGGAVCPNASGSGNINETVATFPANSSLTYTISGTYSTNMNDYPPP